MNLALRIAPLAVLATALSAADGTPPVDAATLWKEKVQPLLAERCYDCHGAKKVKHGLRLDSAEAILKGGKELGPAVVPNKPADSPIFQLTSLKEGAEQLMPPKGAHLTAEQLGWLKDWIAGGAPMGDAKAPAKP